MLYKNKTYIMHDRKTELEKNISEEILGDAAGSVVIKQSIVFSHVTDSLPWHRDCKSVGSTSEQRCCFSHLSWKVVVEVKCALKS